MKETINTSERKELEKAMQNISKEILQLRSALSGYLVGKYHFNETKNEAGAGAIISFDKTISEEDFQTMMFINNAIISLKLFSVKFISEDIIEFDIPQKWNQTIAENRKTYQAKLNDPDIYNGINLLDNLGESILSTSDIIYPQISCTDVEYFFDSTLDAIRRLQEALTM